METGIDGAGFVRHLVDFGAGVAGGVEAVVDVVVAAEEAEEAGEDSIKQPQEQTDQIGPAEGCDNCSSGEKHGFSLRGERRHHRDAGSGLSIQCGARDLRLINDQQDYISK